MKALGLVKAQRLQRDEEVVQKHQATLAAKSGEELIDLVGYGLLDRLFRDFEFEKNVNFIRVMTGSNR